MFNDLPDGILMMKMRFENINGHAGSNGTIGKVSLALFNPPFTCYHTIWSYVL
jgi:hypothetical protein